MAKAYVGQFSGIRVYADDRVPENEIWICHSENNSAFTAKDVVTIATDKATTPTQEEG